MASQWNDGGEKRPRDINKNAEDDVCEEKRRKVNEIESPNDEEYASSSEENRQQDYFTSQGEAAEENINSDDTTHYSSSMFILNSDKKLIYDLLSDEVNKTDNEDNTDTDSAKSQNNSSTVHDYSIHTEDLQVSPMSNTEQESLAEQELANLEGLSDNEYTSTADEESTTSESTCSTQSGTSANHANTEEQLQSPDGDDRNQSLDLHDVLALVKDLGLTFMLALLEDDILLQNETVVISLCQLFHESLREHFQLAIKFSSDLRGIENTQSLCDVCWRRPNASADLHNALSLLFAMLLDHNTVCFLVPKPTTGDFEPQRFFFYFRDLTESETED